MKKKWEIPRRTFLRGAGYALALPLLDAMIPSWQRANATTPPKPRFWAGFYPHGYGNEANQFFPATAGTNYDTTTPFQLSPIAAHKQIVWVLDNLSITNLINPNYPTAPAHSGSVCSLLTCAKIGSADPITAGTSVDQLIAKAIGSTFTPLCVGAPSTSQPLNYRAFSWQSSTQAANLVTSATALFNTLSGQVNDSRQQHTTGTVPKDVQYKRGILHYLNDDLTRLNSNLGAADKARVDEFTTAVAKVDGDLAAQTAPPAGVLTCSIADMNAHNSEISAFAKQVKLLIDLTVMAFQCDITRSSTFVLDNEVSSSSKKYNFLDANNQYNTDGSPKNPINDTYHPLTHLLLPNGSASTSASDIMMQKVKLRQIKRWETSIFAYYLDKMTSTLENNVPLLNTTISFFGSGLASATNHDHHRLPVLFVPQAGAVTGPAKYVKYGTDTPIAQLWHWVLQQYGADTASFGDSSTVLSIG